MPITYVLVENHLTDNPNDYMARVFPIASSGHEQVVDHMLQRGSTITKADAFSVLENYFATVEKLVLDGYNVNTPLANFRTAIKGNFDGADDAYDPERHRIVAVVSPGKRLRKTMYDKATPVKGEAVLTHPNPLDYIDVSNGNQRNNSLTPNGLGRLLGYRLKFDEADPEQGIFFLGEDGRETRVLVIAQNQPKELSFAVPDLMVGSYRLVVRAMFGDKDLRSGELEDSLTVAG